MFICCHHYLDGIGGRALLRAPFPLHANGVAHYPRFRSILGDQLDGGEEDKGRKKMLGAPALVKEECMSWFGHRVAAAASQPEKKAPVVVG